MYPIIKLKSGRESSLNYRHPWVFSGALENIPDDIIHGAMIHLADSTGHIVATGTFSRHSGIAVRIFEFGQASIDDDWWQKRLAAAEERRRLMGYGPDTETTAYRVAFGEADGIPGLIVDRYDQYLSIQLSTAGLELCREQIIEQLHRLFHPRAIVERSDLPVRKEEGLDDVVAVRHGDLSGPVSFKENGLPYMADLLSGQKTGFYLDQKDLRSGIMKYSANGRVLNLFSYTGANAVAALKGGALSVLNIDSSDSALALCQSQLEINDLPREKNIIRPDDVFQWLSGHDRPEFDLVIIDPPALIKARKDFESGRKAYHFLNRAALRQVRAGGFYICSSCSAFLTEDDLALILRRASAQTGVRLDILKTVRQSPDHPFSIYFPEAAYLKSFICLVNR